MHVSVIYIKCEGYLSVYIFKITKLLLIDMKNIGILKNGACLKKNYAKDSGNNIFIN